LHKGSADDSQRNLVIRQRENVAARGINRAIVKTQPCQLLRRAGQGEHNAERGTSSPENVTGTDNVSSLLETAATSAKALDGMVASIPRNHAYRYL